MRKTPRNSISISAAFMIAAVGAPSLSPAIGLALQKDQALSAEARILVRAAIASIGLVLVRDHADPPSQGPRPRGSAVVIRGDGVVATNSHVITNTRTGRPYDELFVSLPDSGSDSLASSKRYLLKPLLINKEYDLALLAIEGSAGGIGVPKSVVFPTIEIGDSKKIRPLEDIFIIGFPEKGGTSVTVNRGVVEGVDRLGKWIKTDARIIHGNSGGAAVNSEGKLVGIPTKVVADEQPVDKNGDGIADEYRRFGAVGFLRPSYLVTEMLEKLDQSNAGGAVSPPTGKAARTLVWVRGVVKSGVTGNPIAGALVGLLPAGAQNVSETNLLTWGSSNAQGEFKLNNAVPAGRYLLRAKALGSRPYTREVEIKLDAPPLIVEIPALRDK